jgi:cell division protein DivIC
MLSLIRSKYFLTLVCFGVWMFFFDDRDVITTHFRHTSELNELMLSKKYYEEQIANTREELRQLKQNDATIEKYAREKYFMKRDNEDLFVIKPVEAE